MSTVFIVIIIVGVVALIGYPLLGRKQTESFEEVKRAKPSVAKEKEALLNTLNEIEFDYHMNKLSEEDYKSLKDNYSEAAVAISQAESKTVPKGKGRKSKPAGTPRTAEIDVTSIEQEIEAELQAMEGSAASVCHRCGTALKEVNQEYCHACGERQF